MGKKEPWYESDSPGRVVRGGSWRVALWIVGVVAFVGLLGAGIWAVKVAVSGPKGAGDATRITNDGRNRVNAQEWFHSQYGQIKTADGNLDQAAANLAACPTDCEDHAFHLTNYTGLKNRCVDMVNAYNAEAGKVSRGKWLDPALPQQIGNGDSATDCKESQTPAPTGS